jgi:hypothetical protein
MKKQPTRWAVNVTLRNGIRTIRLYTATESNKAMHNAYNRSDVQFVTKVSPLTEEEYQNLYMRLPESNRATRRI